MGITGCILAKNEEKRIQSCIENISEIVDEIIVIDNGSEDLTRDIAKRLGANVYSCSDKKLDMARNEYIKRASEEWLFVLDVDERIDNTAKEKMASLMQDRKECTAFMLPRYEYIGDGQWALTTMCRLFRNDKRIHYTDTAMHASVGPSISRINGMFGEADFAIHHLDGLYGKGRMSEKRKRNIALSWEDIERQKSQGKDLYYLYSFLGLEYAALGDFEKAEHIYKEAILMGCDYKPFAQIYLAQNYLLQEKYVQAQQEAKKLIDLQNDIKQRALLLLAEIELQYNNFEKVLSYCEQIEECNHNNAANKLNLATLWMDKDKDKAIEYLLSAKKINPFVMEPIIYNKGTEMNIFAQQTIFLSCTKNAKKLTEILL